jgi:hypothetical protein
MGDYLVHDFHCVCEHKVRENYLYVSNIYRYMYVPYVTTHPSSTRDYMYMY